MKPLVLFLLGLLAGCTAFDKVACYEDTLQQARASPLYRETQAAAAADIPRLIARKGLRAIKRTNPRDRSAFVDSSVVQAARIDDVLFFSPDSSQCVLPVLLQTVDQEDFDEILYAQGTRNGRHWTFATNRLPRVAEVHSLVKKRLVAGHWVNHSFATLSQLARGKVLTFGIAYRRQCAIDPAFWFTE